MLELTFNVDKIFFLEIKKYLSNLYKPRYITRSN